MQYPSAQSTKQIPTSYSLHPDFVLHEFNPPAKYTFHDLTPPGTVLPDSLHKLLGLGLNFCPTPRALTRKNLLETLEGLKRSYRIAYQFRRNPDNRPFNRKLYVPNKDYNPPDADAQAETIFEATSKRINEYTFPRKKRSNLDTTQRRMLKELLERNDLTVAAADKNLGPCVLTTDQYRDLCLDHLNKGNYDLVDKTVDEIAASLRTQAIDFAGWIEGMKPELGRDMQTKIITAYNDDRSVNLMYGLPKIHKKTLAIRPIISNSRGILSGVSKWLDHYLQPYLTQLDSYLRDSDALIETLAGTVHDVFHRFYTYDVVSMYTNIDTEKALELIESYLETRCSYCVVLIEGLRLVMENNYFTFDGTLYHQKNGTAMGTAVAPAWASLYLGIVETTVLKEFDKHVVVYKRFIDDGFVIWKDAGTKYQFKRLLARLKQESGLSFTFEEFEYAAPFLDLTVYFEGNRYLTKTYEKERNLYLYIPSSSAHPPGMLKSLIFGRVLKYLKQNSRLEDQANCIRNLYVRLRSREYTREQLLPLFREAVRKGLTPSTALQVKQNPAQLFLKIGYHPYGPSRSDLAHLFDFDGLQPLLAAVNKEKLTICYTKPRNLKSIVSKADFRSNRDPM